MNQSLEDLMGRLAESPKDRCLDGLEADVSQGIRRRRAQSRVLTAFAPVGIASVALAMAVGLTVGGATAAAAARAHRSADSFSPASSFAPSTLLEGGR